MTVIFFIACAVGAAGAAVVFKKKADYLKWCRRIDAEVAREGSGKDPWSR